MSNYERNNKKYTPRKNYYSKKNKQNKGLKVAIFILALVAICVACYFGGYYLTKLIIK